MILGKIAKDEEQVRLAVEIHCNSCKKSVPGGLKVGEKYSKTKEFKAELAEFVEKYLCGKCRDQKRVKKN